MSGDDELIERLRRTLRAEAGALRPKPQEYPMDQPRVGRVVPFRSRWPLAAVAVAVAAAAAVSVALLVPGSSHRASVVLGTSPSTTPSTVVRGIRVSPGTSPARSIATTTLLPPTTTAVVAPPTTLVNPVVAGAFQPRSVTFVSSDQGWVLGTVPCGASTCLAMAATVDAGHTWRPATPPVATVTPGETVSVRFADPSDGWVRATKDPQSGSQLWSTHDGGRTWTAVPASGYGSGQITELEASGGYARMTVVVPSSAPFLQFYSTPVSADEWTATSPGLSDGAGTPSTQLVLQGGSGWVLQDPDTTDGAILAAGTWRLWSSAPCLKAGGLGALAASDATNLVAVCTEQAGSSSGQQGTAPGLQRLYTSANGGASFQAVGTVPSTYRLSDAITTSGPGVIVAGAVEAKSPSTGGLVASFDGGKTWAPVSTYYSGVQQWADVGFTNPLQGVAVALTGSGWLLLMTRDGGHTWVPIQWDGTNY